VKHDVDNCGLLTSYQYRTILKQLALKARKCQRPYPNKMLYDLDGIQWLRQYLHHTLEDFNFSLAAKATQFFIMFLITVSTFCIVLEAIDSLSQRVEFYYIEWIVSVVFTLEYVVRLACCRDQRAFITKPLNIVDFISFIPF